MNYNKRSYKRIQDVISSIGGIYQFIIVVSICINKLFNNYIILSDTEILLNTSIYKAKTYKFEFLKKKLNGETKKEGINQPNNKGKLNTEKPINKSEVIKNNQSNSTNNCMTSHDHININKIKMENELNKQNLRSSLIKTHKKKIFVIFFYINYLVVKLIIFFKFIMILGLK